MNIKTRITRLEHELSGNNGGQEMHRFFIGYPIDGSEPPIRRLTEEDFAQYCQTTGHDPWAD